MPNKLSFHVKSVPGAVLAAPLRSVWHLRRLTQSLSPEAESAALMIRLDSEAVLVVSELARVESSERCYLAFDLPWLQSQDASLT